MLEIKNLSGIVTFARVVGTFTLGRAPRSSGPARPRRGARLCLALSGRKPSADSIQPCDACSSSMARRRCPRRSAAPLDAMRRSSVAKFDKARNILERLPKSMHALGNGRRRKGRNADSQSRPPLEPDWNGVSAGSWKGSTRCSPSQGSASLANRAARSLAPTSSRMSWARCAGSAATSNTGARPRWPCDGPPPPCRTTKGFRRSKAYKHLPALRAALAKQGQQPPSDEALVQITETA